MFVRKYFRMASKTNPINVKFFASIFFLQTILSNAYKVKQVLGLFIALPNKC